MAVHVIQVEKPFEGYVIASVPWGVDETARRMAIQGIWVNGIITLEAKQAATILAMLSDLDDPSRQWMIISPEGIQELKGRVEQELREKVQKGATR